MIDITIGPEHFTDEYQALRYCASNKQRSRELEQYFLNHDIIAASTYAINVLQKRWKAIEPLLVKESPNRALNYASTLKITFPSSLENQLIDAYVGSSFASIKQLIGYAIECKKKRWPELEEVMLEIARENTNQDLYVSGFEEYYNTFFSKHDQVWEELDNVLLNSFNVRRASYFFTVAFSKRKRWEELEDRLIEMIKAVKHVNPNLHLNGPELISKVTREYLKTVESRFYEPMEEVDDKFNHAFGSDPSKINESTAPELTSLQREATEALQDPVKAYNFCTQRLGKRWKPAEIVIAQHPGNLIRYMKHFNIKNDRYLENIFLKYTTSSMCALYVSQVKKAVWLAFEKQELAYLETMDSEQPFHFGFFDYVKNTRDPTWPGIKDALVTNYKTTDSIQTIRRYLNYNKSISTWPEIEAAIEEKHPGFVPWREKDILNTLKSRQPLTPPEPS